MMLALVLCLSRQSGIGAIPFGFARVVDYEGTRVVDYEGNRVIGVA